MTLPSKRRSRSVKVVDCGERLLAPATVLEVQQYCILAFEIVPADLVFAEALFDVSRVCWPDEVDQIYVLVCLSSMFSSCTPAGRRSSAQGLSHSSPRRHSNHRRKWEHRGRGGCRPLTQRPRGPRHQGTVKDPDTPRESSCKARRLMDRILRGAETLMATAQGDLRGAHEDDASLCAARLHSIQAAQRPAQYLRTYALWATTCGTTPQAARRALWHYRDFIETYSAAQEPWV